MTLNFDEMEMTAIWNEINSKLNEEPGPIEEIHTSYSFDLSGDDGGLFGLRIADGKAETLIGDPGEVDCALSMSVKDFKKLLAGNLNSTASYMLGKLKVKGNLGHALKLESLLKKYTF
ncbi:SCP2 sterol-binding domain-containing protein [Sporosarcina siberiensis]|uniref:SCP2 sterol-binding domain-containing protein n=1 Tax=Sporosarcina siberiensis TaxID=1365606 RepID=A0ABW4SBS0_9BACL